VIVTDGAGLPADWRLKIPGAHNRYDAALALEAVRALGGIPDEASRSAIESFQGVPGRLELILQNGGIKVYNDTTATTPEATLAALEALQAPVILIMGGTDKNLNMHELLTALPVYTKHVIFLAGSGTDRIRDTLPDAPVYDVLKDAVADAFAHAKSGDTILFSPAFTSFGMFKNEYDRGDQFIALIRTYAD
jgi:UDP-N-acetylmuramoylalanine--D-glutamate ligase